MNKNKKQIPNDLAQKEYGSNNKFLSHLNSISSDVSFVLSLAAFLGDNERHGKDLTVIDVKQKLVPGLKPDDGRLDNISYEKYRELLESVNRNGDVLKICKEIYSSRISNEGKDFILAINIFFQWIGDREYENDIEDEMRTIRMKHLTKELEWHKAEIASLAKKKAMKYDKELREYAKEKKRYEEHLEKIYRESDLNRIQTETRNKDDMSIYSANVQNILDELQKTIEEKQRTLVTSHETNIVEIENMNNKLLKKGLLLDVINSRYSNDMLMRYNNRESLQQIIKSKIRLYETLKVNVMNMEMHIEELEEDEKMYFKREFYDKLDAIKEKIALRAISKLLIPYINLKFKSKRRQLLKNKNKNKKKMKK